MPIEFQCHACQARIRTPDNTAGKSARCPKCSTVLTIPGAAGAAPPSPAAYAPGPTSPPQPPGFSVPHPLGAPAGNPLGASSANPLGGPPPGKAPNPFVDRPAPGFAPPNPYASPSAAGHYQAPGPMYGSREAVRSWLLGPAIGCLLFAVVGLGFMAMVGLGMAIDPDAIADQAPPDEAGKAGFYGFFIVYFVGGLLTRLLQIVGAICMFRVRNHSLAMAAAVCALLPCDVYCCIPCLPFGIWGLIVLNKPEVKAAFQQP